MFEMLKEKVINGEFDYRPDVITIGKKSEKPNNYFIYQDVQGMFIVGATGVRGEVLGSRKFDDEQKAQEDVLSKILSQKTSYQQCQERGEAYFSLPI